MSEPSDTPGFDQDERDPAWIAELDLLMTALSADAPDPALLSRLQASVAQPPLRYAPFFARLAGLFDLTQEATIAHCARLAEPGVWRFAGLPGVRNVLVQGGPGVQGAEVVFARFEPGLYFPAHAHTGLERVLVLEGSYEDSHGVVHRAGELREWPPGSAHAFRVGRQEPCIFASVVFGREFRALPLRLLARVLGR